MIEYSIGVHPVCSIEPAHFIRMHINSQAGLYANNHFAGFIICCFSPFYLCQQGCE